MRGALPCSFEAAAFLLGYGLVLGACDAWRWGSPGIISGCFALMAALPSQCVTFVVPFAASSYLNPCSTGSCL